MKLIVVCMSAMALLLAGCNTVEGLGKDIKKGGEAIEKSAKQPLPEKQSAKSQRKNQANHAMNPFTTLDGLVAPLDRANVDTDAIIPKQYLKSIKRSGFGPTLFDEWRYLDVGQPGQDHSKRPLNPDFVLNQPRFQGASILLVRENFGCGSSREHAPWAIEDFGFRAILGTTFADIFFNNCFKNGLLPIRLPQTELEQLFLQCAGTPGYRLRIDLESQTVIRPDGHVIRFDVEAFRKYCLLNGFDDIGLTLRQADKIREFEARRRIEQPWLFA